jgi:probable biosynthetic protein (TIGR04098 family)
VLGDGWEPVGSFVQRHRIDVDRDTNGAGLVYFANYVSFMDTAERLALAELGPAPPKMPSPRTLRHRRIGYYGNADVDDAITITVSVLHHPAAAESIGLRYRIEREADGRTICLSEAIKAASPR